MVKTVQQPEQTFKSSPFRQKDGSGRYCGLKATTQLYFDLIDVKLFVNIAESNSLTRGAANSHISLPAASKRIKNIEDKLGISLFYRNSQGVTLTPAGQVFLKHGHLLLQDLEHLSGALQQYARGVTGRVRIFANTTAITDFLPGVVRKFLVTHPDVNVDLKEGVSHDIVHAVSQGTTDIGVGIALGSLCTDGLEVLPYRRDRLVLATAVDHTLSRHRIIGFDETLGFNHIGLAETSPIQVFLNQVATDLHQSLRIRTRVANFEDLCHMVEMNVGIGVLPESAARRHSGTMAIQVIQLSDEWAEHNLQIFVRDRQLLPAFSQELIDLLIKDSPPGID
jgi:DNA-binding transcriptional LysR family regulator